MRMIAVTFTEGEAEQLRSYLRLARVASEADAALFFERMADRIEVAIERDRLQQDARPGGRSGEAD